jgi:hypothetical protein
MKAIVWQLTSQDISETAQKTKTADLKMGGKSLWNIKQMFINNDQVMNMVDEGNGTGSVFLSFSSY